MFAVEVGPYLELSRTDRAHVTLGGGLAVAYANRSCGIVESVAIAGVPTVIDLSSPLGLNAGMNWRF